MEEKQKTHFFSMIFDEEGHFLQKWLVGNFYINPAQRLSALRGT